MSEVDKLTSTPAHEVLRDSDRVSVGVVRILNAIAGTPGDEREYETGDEALVENGVAEWVVAPVHLPAAGRRLDHDAEREATPLGGIETYPPAEPTDAARRATARQEGYVDAHSDEGLAENLAGQRAKVARKLATDSDAATQARLGGLGARSGPVNANSDLAADKARDTAATSPAGDEDKGSRSTAAAKGKS